MLKIYNTLTRKKELFQPRVAGKVGMYVCGMTVYDYCHIGHARVMVVFDTVARHLRHSGYDLTYVRNITDIDDKIIQRAHENGEEFGALTERFITAMHEDERALAVLPPDREPRATQAIADIIAMIEALITKGLAYIGGNGDVFYSVSKFKTYGQLSGKNLDDLQAGERVDVDTAKQNPLDFVLWKMAKANEPAWKSPWGLGRPGWHIECSAMSAHHLGQHFDIHGGGQDLQFPHHENEIAQSEAAHSHDGKPCQMVNYWMHNGFVRVDDEKMSKSLGNFFTIRTVLEQYDAEVVRFFILRAHYRSPLNYSDQHLDDAKSALTRLYTALRGADVTDGAVDWQHPQAARFKDAMDDDFNTPEAMAVLFDLANELNKTKQLETANLLKGLGKVLGLLQSNPTQYLQGTPQILRPALFVNENIFYSPTVTSGSAVLDIDKLIVLRSEAKKAKSFAEADRIRKELADNGIILEDTPQGTTWRRA